MSEDYMDQDEAITSINVTPLVDVMLVLLIIFMVTANFIVRNQMGLDLPDAKTGTTAEKSMYEFVIDAEEKVSLNGQTITMDQVAAELASARSQSPGQSPTAVIAADKAVKHGVFVKLLDVLRENNVPIAIQVEAAN
jgi:biopolymer transport protein ExbD